MPVARCLKCALLFVALALLAAPAPVPAFDTAPAPEKGTVLVTGANRGLGLEFARQFRAAGWTVIGTARTPAEAETLRQLGARVEPLDVTDAESVAALAQSLEGTPVDLLINNAGISSGGGPGMTIEQLDLAAAERVLQVNTLGPMRVTQALLPNLRAGEGKLIVNITSRLGSIELNERGGYHGYRESKSALNMFTRSIAAELKPEGFTCIVMSPGWVRTRMGGPNARLSPEESIEGMIGVIRSLTPDDTGTFRNHAGERLPW